MCKEIVTGQDAGAAENVLLQLSVLASFSAEAEKSVLDPVSVDSPTGSVAASETTLTSETSNFEASTTVFEEVPPLQPEGSC